MKKLVSAVIATLLLSSASAAFAADVAKVTKLRLSKVVMFDGPNGAPIGEIQKDQYVAGSWQVAGEPQAGYIKVNGDGKSFWVKAMAIDTDKRVATSAECGVKVVGSAEKIGATRALGEECK